MRCDIIHNYDQKIDLLNLADEAHDLRNIFDGFPYKDEALKHYVAEQSWIATFTSDAGKLYGFAVLEWTDYRVVSLHLSIFNRGNIYKGWKLLIKSIEDSVDEMEVYIPHDRSDVIKIASFLGFKLTKEERYYYGRIKAESTT